MKKEIIAAAFVSAMAASLLAGCGSKDSGSGSASQAAAGTGYAKEIYLYNWSEYMTQDVLDQFEKEYGIKVVESTYESNDEMFAKLMAGNDGQYDIAVPSNFYIQAMVANNLLEPIDWDKVPNYANVDDAYKNLSYDPDGKYTIPYMGTVACWIGNTEKLKELGVTVDTYKDLENPALAGNILFSDDAQGNICCGLSAMGLDPTSNNLEDIAKAKDYLMSINKSVKAYSLPADVRDAMIKDEAAAAYMYSGNAMQAMLENDKLAVIMNKEQVSLSVDTMVLLKGSKHKEESELFLNFLLRPEISAELLKEFPYVCFNKAAYDKLDKELAESPLCVLTDDMKKRIYMLVTFDGDAIDAEVNAMTEVKASR